MNLDKHKLESTWHQKYPECQPRGEVLRQVYKDRWVRFHSLPKSKRYPENDSEYKIMLERHNALLNELDPGYIVVITSEWTEDSEVKLDSKSKRAELEPDAEHWQTFFAGTRRPRKFEF